MTAVLFRNSRVAKLPCRISMHTVKHVVLNCPNKLSTVKVLLFFFFFILSQFLSYKFHNWKQIPVLLLAKTEKLPGERDLLCHNARVAPC